jgi:hypothetical protein
MDWQEVISCQSLPGIGLGAMLVDVLFDKTLLVDDACRWG